MQLAYQWRLIVVDWFEKQKKIVFRTQMLARIRESQGLNKEYQEAFQRTKERLRENPNERQFEFRYT